MPTLTRTPEIALNYEVLGSGEPLLFLNGSGSTIADIRPLLGQLAQGFTVAVADSRGLGGSSPVATPYAMADLAADAIALADAQGWDTFNLAGMSFGGMVAQEVAVTVPERIRRLVLMCTSSGGAGGSSYPLHELTALPDDERAATMMQLFDTRFTPEFLAAHPEQLAALTEMAGPTPAEPTPEQQRGSQLQLQARMGHDVYDRLDRICCPTLVAVGRYDGIAPEQNGAAIAARIPGGRLQSFDGGHGFSSCRTRRRCRRSWLSWALPPAEAPFCTPPRPRCGPFTLKLG